MATTLAALIVQGEKISDAIDRATHEISLFCEIKKNNGVSDKDIEASPIYKSLLKQHYDLSYELKDIIDKINTAKSKVTVNIFNKTIPIDVAQEAIDAIDEFMELAVSYILKASQSKNLLLDAVDVFNDSMSVGDSIRLFQAQFNIFITTKNRLCEDIENKKDTLYSDYGIALKYTNPTNLQQDLVRNKTLILKAIDKAYKNHIIN